jgi:hypothetical protein
MDERFRKIAAKERNTRLIMEIKKGGLYDYKDVNRKFLMDVKRLKK